MNAAHNDTWDEFREEIFLLTGKGKLGRPLHLFEEVESTNDTLAELASRGAEEGTVVIADRQLRGRGRNGRGWESPAGKGLWMSVLLKPEVAAETLGALSLGAALATLRALREVAPVGGTIKWPNDVLAGDRKVAGVLLESRLDGNKVQFVVVGIGVNVSQKREDFSPDLRKTAVSLEEAGGAPVRRAELAAALLRELERAYSAIASGGWEELRQELAASSSMIGRRVVVRTGRETVQGTAFDFSEDGGLVVREDSGVQRRITAGEVTLM